MMLLDVLEIALLFVFRQTLLGVRMKLMRGLGVILLEGGIVDTLEISPGYAEDDTVVAADTAKEVEMKHSMGIMLQFINFCPHL